MEKNTYFYSEMDQIPFNFVLFKNKAVNKKSAPTRL